MTRLESQVEFLENAAQRTWGKITDQNNIIRVGCKDLSFCVRLGTKLHARLNQVDRILKGSRWTPSSVRAIIVQKNKNVSRVSGKTLDLSPLLWDAQSSEGYRYEVVGTVEHGRRVGDLRSMKPERRNEDE